MKQMDIDKKCKIIGELKYSEIQWNHLEKHKVRKKRKQNETSRPRRGLKLFLFSNNKRDIEKVSVLRTLTDKKNWWTRSVDFNIKPSKWKIGARR